MTADSPRQQNIENKEKKKITKTEKNGFAEIERSIRF